MQMPEKMKSIRAGTVLFADADFTCLKANARVVVAKDVHGYFVPCAKGHHYLDGQLDDKGYCVGLSRTPWRAL